MQARERKKPREWLAVYKPESNRETNKDLTYDNMNLEKGAEHGTNTSAGSEANSDSKFML